MSMNPLEEEFQEEVLKLFALEALEWLRQIKSALPELVGEPAPERAAKVYDTVLRGLTNLKGSAATVDLPSLENLAYTLVPLLQAMQGKKIAGSSKHYAALQQGLESLSSAVQLLAVADKKLDAVADLERITQRQADAVQSAVAEAQAVAPSTKAEGMPAPTNSVAIIEALLDLKRPRLASTEMNRNLVEVVLRKIHGVLDMDSASVTAASITRIMHDLEVLDERFLEEARQRLATIATVLADLKPGGGRDAAAQEKQFQTALQEIALLYETARAVDATMVVQFLHGLETLLMEVFYKRVNVLPQRFEVVGARLKTLLAEAQKWVDVGRAERTVIEKVLAQLMGSTPQSKS